MTQRCLIRTKVLSTLRPCFPESIKQSADMDRSTGQSAARLASVLGIADKCHCADIHDAHRVVQICLPSSLRSHQLSN